MTHNCEEISLKNSPVFSLKVLNYLPTRNLETRGLRNKSVTNSTYSSKTSGSISTSLENWWPKKSCKHY